MSESQRLTQEEGVLRWGGLAGILGSIVFVIVFAIVIVVVGEDPNEPMAFSGIRVARTVEDGLYLAVLVMWILHFLALYRGLRDEGLAPALFGTVLGIVGTVILAAGALPHVATLAVSDLLHAPGATADEQAALELMWKAVYSVFDALLIVGLIVASTGVVCIGAAMIKGSKYGKGIGWFSVAIGVAGFAGASVLLWDPSSMLAVLAVFGLILFHAAAGWKTYRMSRLL